MKHRFYLNTFTIESSYSRGRFAKRLAKKTGDSEEAINQKILNLIDEPPTETDAEPVEVNGAGSAEHYVPQPA